MADATFDIIAECFQYYVNDNWCESNFSAPDTIAVMTEKESPGKYKGFAGSCLLISRGEVQFMSVDLGTSLTSGGFRFRTWRSNLFMHHTSSANLQGMYVEFLRILSKWEAGGGGTFSDEDADNLKYVDNQTLEVHNARSADVHLVLNGYYEQAAVAGSS